MRHFGKVVGFAVGYSEGQNEEAGSDVCDSDLRCCGVALCF